jgi:hypothetical protein
VKLGFPAQGLLVSVSGHSMVKTILSRKQSLHCSARIASDSD